MKIKNLFDKIEKSSNKEKRQLLGILMMFGFIYSIMTLYSQLGVLSYLGFYKFLGTLYLNTGNILLIILTYYLLTREFKYDPGE